MQFSESKNESKWDGDSIPRIVSVILQNLRITIILSLLGMLVGFIAVLCVKPRYEVSSTLMLQLGHELAAPPTVDETRVLPNGKRSEDLANEIEIMSSQGLVKELVDAFGEDYFTREAPAVTSMQKAKRSISKTITSVRETLDDAIVSVGIRRKLTKKESIVLALQSSLEVEPARKSDITRVSLQIQDPDVGEEILKKFIDLYLVKHVNVFKASKTKSFFESETAGILEKIKKLQLDRQEFKKNSNVSSTEIERKLLLDQAETIRAARTELIGEKTRMAAEVAFSTKLLPTLPRELQTLNVKQRNPLLATMESKLSTLESDRDLAILRYKEASRTVADLDSQISLFKPKITTIPELIPQTITSGLNSAVLDIEREIDAKNTQIAGLDARLVELDKSLESLQTRIVNLDVAENRLRDIERELIQCETTYTMYRKSSDQAQLEDALNQAQMANVVVVDPPMASLRPVWPNAKIWVIAGALAGAFFGLGIGILSDTINPAARSDTDVKGGAAAEVLARLPSDEKNIDDVYRQLAIDLRSAIDQPGSFIVTSPYERDKIKLITVRVAKALVTEGAKSVLIIDFSSDGPTGYSKPLKSSQLADWNPGQPIPADTSLDSGVHFTCFGDQILKAESSSKLLALHRDACQQFEYVIWCAPAMLARSEVKRVAKIVGSVILIVEAHMTRINDLKGMQEQCKRSGAKLIGAVVNRYDRYLPRVMRNKNHAG